MVYLGLEPRAARLDTDKSTELWWHPGNYLTNRNFNLCVLTLLDGKLNPYLENFIRAYFVLTDLIPRFYHGIAKYKGLAYLSRLLLKSLLNRSIFQM